MMWLSEHGVAQSYRDYLDLPEQVLEDCRILAKAERMKYDIEKSRAGRP